LSPIITLFKSTNNQDDLDKLLKKRLKLENNLDSKIDNDIVEDWQTIYDKAKLITDLDDKLLVYCFLFVPLRRDIATLKIRNFNKQTDNFYFNSKIVFNSLVKRDGRKSGDVPKVLDDLIKNVMLINLQ